MSQGYYEQVSQAFDGAALGYDALYTNNRAMAWMRVESLAVLRATFPPPEPVGGTCQAGSDPPDGDSLAPVEATRRGCRGAAHLLEIGCGTGEEALALSQLEYQIVATDISPAMIRAAEAKAQTAGIQSITWRVLSAGQLAELTREYGAASFDGAYSSFGALNCEPRLEQVAAALAHLLRPGASLVCSVMNRWCIWEIGWSLLHLRPGQAVRRLRTGWVAAGLASDVGSASVPVRYYGSRAFARAFAPHFTVQRVLGLPVFLPPPYLDHLVARHESLFARLEALERRLRRRFPFYALGDHFLVVMRRTAIRQSPPF